MIKIINKLKLKFFIYKKKKEIKKFIKQLEMMGWILNERNNIKEDGSRGELSYICGCEPSPMFNRNGENDLSMYKGFRISHKEKSKSYLGTTRNNILNLYNDVEKAEKLIQRFEKIKHNIKQI